MAESVRFGIEYGQLNYPPGTFIEPAEAEFLQPHQLTLLTAGSQAEPNSALSRLAADVHPLLHIEPEDTVVLSSRFIPGNERPINTLINELFKLGAEVIYEGVAPVHVSGHACRDELAELIRLVRPRYFVPVHGEYRHLVRHLQLAAETGVARANCFLLEDGDSLVLDGAMARRGSSVKAGRIPIDEEGFGNPVLVGERVALAQSGAIVAIVAVSAASRRIVAGPELVSRGVVTGDGTSPHMRQARAELAARLALIDSLTGPNDLRLRTEIIRALRDYFIDAVGRRPVVLPHVMEVR